jgi:hypothetical protein
MQPPFPGSGRNRKRVELPKGPATPNKLRVEPKPPKVAVKPVTDKMAVNKPAKPMVDDDKIYRTMPITQKQLGQIKKMYGIK